jgi:hypothetical protein
VYNGAVAKANKTRRRSIPVPLHLDKLADATAKSRNTSSTRVLVALMEAGARAQAAEKERFFELATRLTETTDAAERQRIKKELARMTFGD